MAGTVSQKWGLVKNQESDWRLSHPFMHTRGRCEFDGYASGVSQQGGLDPAKRSGTIALYSGPFSGAEPIGHVRVPAVFWGSERARGRG